MGAEPYRADHPERVASLAAMCRQLTAELFVEHAVPAAPPARSVTSPPKIAGKTPAPPTARTDLIIPPPQPAAAPASAAPQPPTLLADAPPAAEAAVRDRAAQSLADLRPRRFDTASEVPTVRAGPPEPPQTRTHPTLPIRGAPSISRLSNRKPSRDDDVAPPEIPHFLGPTSLTVAEGDRPAAVRAATGRSLFARLPVPGRKPVAPATPDPATPDEVGRPAAGGRPLRLGVPEQFLRTASKAKPKANGSGPAKRRRFPVGTVTGLTVFAVVAGAALAGTAVAPRIAGWVGPDNAPHIEVAEVEGVADALVPLPLIVDAATGTRLSSVVIDGVPRGARLNAGRSSGNGSWILPPEELPDLALVPPRGFAGELSLLISAVAVDGLERVSQTATLHITIMPHNRTPQIHATRRI